jgi:hypothetical protein
MPIMVVSGKGQRHIIPVSNWSDRDLHAVALTYEASGFDVAIGTERI